MIYLYNLHVAQRDIFFNLIIKSFLRFSNEEVIK